MCRGYEYDPRAILRYLFCEQKIRLATVFCFYIVDFKRQKKGETGETRSQTLTQGDIVFKNPTRFTQMNETLKITKFNITGFVLLLRQRVLFIFLIYKSFYQFEFLNVACKAHSLSFLSATIGRLQNSIGQLHCITLALAQQCFVFCLNILSWEKRDSTRRLKLKRYFKDSFFLQHLGLLGPQQDTLLIGRKG